MRLISIKGEIKPDHTFLTDEDTCFYFGEFFTDSDRYNEEGGLNNFINNLKKPPSRKGMSDWHYKVTAINDAAGYLSNATKNLKADITLCPIPPSKASSDEDYDPRISEICHKVVEMNNNDINCIEVLETERTRASLRQSNSRNPDHIYESLCISGDLSQVKKVIILVDDVLTTGCTFTACKRKLNEIFPGNIIIGIFIARRVPP